ncbi:MULTISPECIES: GMC family oxidoreductase [unclassified Agarivorans]|uniref:GMC family oxidoreductase n=1 Tax=unclassified Agarivorans TaxID=2636026 RepID=UPI0026E3A6EB|nr:MULTISPECIES: GMC family oxidoreductase [unclassified Agarivorans]MDO6685612.1 GMC family oxidoreductase [Agarivorans sp. 3_MG-2023]MDO6715998.1 GMC family oxidoreductase [Agarivorans sp. 2_MG-2023]
MIKDIIAEGLAAGWQHIDGAEQQQDKSLECDVLIVGSGAGGGITAQVLTQAGLKVLIVEEGPLKSSQDFKMQERQAYPDLYQESAARKTKDKAIGIFQGRCVGGSTTVNWTTSLRTPEHTLSHWQQRWGFTQINAVSLAPYFQQAEQMLGIQPWLTRNQNNSLLAKGCDALGWSYQAIPRNVKQCWDLGYCGMGCPTNAKQSMLVTTIPTALNAGASLLSRFRVQQLTIENDQVVGAQLTALNKNQRATKRVFTIKAKHVVLAAGAIGSPAILLRSKVPDPYQRVGKRTFLHPSVMSGALFEHVVASHQGAPQSVYSDHFVWQNGSEGACGYKLEVPPVHPILLATKTTGFGQFHSEMMQQINHLQVTIALLRDGFHDDSVGGQVQLRNDGSPVLDYSISDYLWQGARRALLSMAELQFAAGAKKVYPLHEQSQLVSSWAEAKKLIKQLPMQALATRLASAHVMGGCAMGGDEQNSAVDEAGNYRWLSGLSVIDGSVFPTSLGANPQLSIYAMALRNAELLAKSLRR